MCHSGVLRWSDDYWDQKLLVSTERQYILVCVVASLFLPAIKTHLSLSLLSLSLPHHHHHHYYYYYYFFNFLSFLPFSSINSQNNREVLCFTIFLLGFSSSYILNFLSLSSLIIIIIIITPKKYIKKPFPKTKFISSHFIPSHNNKYIWTS